MPTAKQRAYEKIRKSIFSGTFPPGSHLREEELARVCKASRTPVRQAIRMLASEGLVTIGANKRCYVSNVDETHAEEIFDLLAFLEGYSAGLAAERIGKQMPRRQKKSGCAQRGPERGGERSCHQAKQEAAGDGDPKDAGQRKQGGERVNANEKCKRHETMSGHEGQ